MLSIAEKIQLIRSRKGFTQEELARYLSVSFPTVNAWERGKSQPYSRHNRAIEKLYQEVVDDSLCRQVMIVEDDESSGMVLADYVEMALPTWHSEVVSNGYDAILKIGSQKPSLILLDIMMPDIDGFKVFGRLKEMEELSPSKVIFVTAATGELLEKAKASDAFAVIQKPFDREEIIRILQRAAEELQAEL